MKPNVLAIVPARGGSKGILRKNIARLAGRPLLCWSIGAAQDSASVNRVIVSSDCSTILRVARECGAQAMPRPDALATDAAPSEPVVTHVLETLQAREQTLPDIIVLLQPTTPLRTAEDVDKAIEILQNPEFDSVISVYSPKHSPFKAFVAHKNGSLRGLVSDDAPFKRRQDLPEAYYPNGAIYAIRTEAFLRNEKLMTSRTAPLLMPEERSIDIDDVDDLELAEEFLRKASAPRRDSRPPAWSEAMG